MSTSGAFPSTVLGWALRCARVPRCRALQYGDEIHPTMPVVVGDAAAGRNDTPVEAGEKLDLCVTWSGRDDPENPFNWPTWLKCWVTFLISFITTIVYVGSSVYSTGKSGPRSVMEELDVGQTTALLGLSLYVIAYGLGPVLLHPIAELPQSVLIMADAGTLLVFTVVQIPTAMTNNIHALLGLRFLAGFMAAPPLAFGGATLSDMFGPRYLTAALIFWAFGAIAGPMGGPLIGGFIFENCGWRWTIWVTLIASGVCLLLVVCSLPETRGAHILHRRMHRLRRATGNSALTTAAAADFARRGAKAIVVESLWRPVELLLEPTLLLYNSYLALIYGLFYLFFESFPLIFGQVHGFAPGTQGLAYVGMMITSVAGLAAYLYWVYTVYQPKVDAADEGGAPVYPEMRLQPCVVAAALIPIAMFGTGWSGQYASVHWIVPIIMSSFFPVGGIIIFQSVFAYYGDIYNAEMGAVLSLSDIFRGSLAGAFPLFAHAMFKHLGIGGACSLLGGITLLFYPAPWLFLK